MTSDVNQLWMPGIFNFFFIIRLLIPNAQEIEFKDFFIHIISLGSFIAVYSSSTNLLSNKELKQSFSNQVASFAILAITVLLVNQLLQIYDGSKNFTSRPGGLLNPNSTAIVALLLAYTTIKLSQLNSQVTARFTYISLALTVCIVLLSQSRSALIGLIPLIIFTFRRNLHFKNVIISVGIITVIIVITSSISNDFRELLSSYILRFKGDFSSGHRISLLQSGWIAFTESPIWGNGYRYIANMTGYSTHNEIIETLANYGVFGLLIFSIACYFLYTPFSILFFIVCILPALLFTHNFFDLYAFQTSLGLALAAERFHQKNNSIP